MIWALVLLFWWLAIAYGAYAAWKQLRNSQKFSKHQFDCLIERYNFIYVVNKYSCHDESLDSISKHYTSILSGLRNR